MVEGAAEGAWVATTQLVRSIVTRMFKVYTKILVLEESHGGVSHDATEVIERGIFPPEIID